LIAFWPARVAAGIRAQLLRLLHVQPDFLSESGDHSGVRARARNPRHNETGR
jgi:hypothetical protein